MDSTENSVVEEGAAEHNGIPLSPDDTEVYIRHPETNEAYSLNGPMAQYVWETEFKDKGFEIFADEESVFLAVDSGPDVPADVDLDNMTDEELEEFFASTDESEE